MVEGLVSSILTVLDTIAALYNDIKNVDVVPTEFCEITQRLPIIRATLRIAEAHINTRSLDEEAFRSIKAALAGCKDKGLRLEVVFRKSVPTASTLGSEPYRLAVNALGRRYRAELLMRGMLEDVKLVGENQAVNAVTGAEVSKLVKAIEELSAMPLSLQPEDRSGNSVNNIGPGTIYTNFGDGPQNNLTGTGTQYVSQHQYFGSDSLKQMKHIPC